MISTADTNAGNARASAYGTIGSTIGNTLDRQTGNYLLNRYMTNPGGGTNSLGLSAMQNSGLSLGEPLGYVGTSAAVPWLDCGHGAGAASPGRAQVVGDIGR